MSMDDERKRRQALCDDLYSRKLPDGTRKVVRGSRKDDENQCFHYVTDSTFFVGIIYGILIHEAATWIGRTIAFTWYYMEGLL